MKGQRILNPNRVEDLLPRRLHAEAGNLARVTACHNHDLPRCGFFDAAAWIWRDPPQAKLRTDMAMLRTLLILLALGDDLKRQKQLLVAAWAGASLVAPSAQQQALVVLVGLRLGFIDSTRAIKWADLVIAESANAEEGLIELSLAQNEGMHDVVGLVRSLAPKAGTREEAEFTLALLHHMRELGQIGLDQGTRVFASLIHTGLLTSDEESLAYHFDDGYQLALNGICGTLEELDQEFAGFLRPFWATHQAALSRVLDMLT